MLGYDLTDQIDAELVTYGMSECHCDTARGEYPICVVCSREVDSINHVHYKSQPYDMACLTLALLRQLNQK